MTDGHPPTDDSSTDDRELSFWGWGYADRFPDDDERRALAERLQNQLGFPERPLLDPPALDDVDVPGSAFDDPGLASDDPGLASDDPESASDDPGPASDDRGSALALPDDLVDFCTADDETRVRHTYGRAYRDLVRGFRGDFSPAPDLVARPRDEDDVADLLAWATDERVAVVPYGGGTSVVGGVEPAVGDGYAGVVSLDVRAMDRVLEVDETSRTARVQAGATGPELNDQLADHGLQFRHYPQSYEFSTVGGWVATRSGGHFATRYTHVDDLVESVRAVTPAGTLETGRVPASGAGPDPNAFLLGSEGAFGVVTEAWLRVQPRPPYRARASVRFEDFGDAVAATRRVVQARLTPANCRLLDRNEAMLNEVAMDGSHVLLLGFESTDHPVGDALDRALDICKAGGGRVRESPTYESPADGGGEDGDGSGGAAAGGDATDGDRTGGEGDRTGGEGDWRSSFFEAPYLFNALVSVGVLVDTFETAVTWDRFPALHADLRETVTGTLADVCGTGFLACRFTHVYEDGPAPYYTVLAPAEVGAELEQWRAVKRAASDVLADHGATITHHHAVGRVHREWYDREVPDGYRRALGAMKRTLDPEGVMNPGVLVE